MNDITDKQMIIELLNKVSFQEDEIKKYLNRMQEQDEIIEQLEDEIIEYTEMRRLYELRCFFR